MKRRARAPAYTHRDQSGRLYAQIRMKDGQYFSRALDTDDSEIGRARMLPIIGELVAAEKVEPGARVCRIYALRRCPTCGRGHEPSQEARQHGQAAAQR
jgi:hypothetical protein